MNDVRVLINNNGGHFRYQIWTFWMIRLEQSVLYLCSRTFRCSYLMFALCVMQQRISSDTYYIIWKTCGYVLVELHFIRWKFTNVIEKFSRISLFLGHSIHLIHCTRVGDISIISSLPSLLYGIHSCQINDISSTVCVNFTWIESSFK